VGDFALFASYLASIAWLPRWLGMLLARHKHAGVSLDRMTRLVPEERPENLVAHAPVYLRGPMPEVARQAMCVDDRLQLLTAEGLTYRYPESDCGIESVNLRVERGSFTVIAGRVGSGKTTLVRVLLGLLPAESGVLRWNGARVTDPGAFFVPPRCAYVPQVSHLFSETIADNVLMGLPAEAVDLHGALRLAALDVDVHGLPDGLQTRVGARGVRLSGGQAQRTAAARMFVRSPELLVFDDLSSALDVETERQLWERVFAQETTCLVVSHRRAVLRRADHIVLLEQGRVSAEGTLGELLRDSAEMRRLWDAESEPARDSGEPTTVEASAEPTPYR
ncbi:MAG: ATP-binding cassette domain-containing protein, partial [Dehalococcoidia bacterium]